MLFNEPLWRHSLPGMRPTSLNANSFVAPFTSFMRTQHTNGRTFPGPACHQSRTGQRPCRGPISPASRDPPPASRWVGLADGWGMMGNESATNWSGCRCGWINEVSKRKAKIPLTTGEEGSVPLYEESNGRKQWTDTLTPHFYSTLAQASRWILYLAPVIPRRSRTRRCCEVFNLPLCRKEETKTARELGGMVEE